MKLSYRYFIAGLITFAPLSLLAEQISIDNFAIIEKQYSITEDLEAIVGATLGGHYRVADWHDIERYFNAGGDAARFLELLSGAAFVTLNGEGFLAGNQHYFAAPSAGTIPTDFRVREQVGNHAVVLGAWYYRKYILAYMDTPSAESVTEEKDHQEAP
jgi:hypothetical protein